MPQRLLNLLRPPDLPQSDDPDEQRKYRTRVNRYHFNIAACVATLLVLTAWAASPYGFARAADIQPQIDKALVPVKNDLTQLQTAVSELAQSQKVNNRRLAQSLSNSIAGEIRLLASKRCQLRGQENTSEERERLTREIDRKQEEYFELRQTNYSIPNCEDL